MAQRQDLVELVTGFSELKQDLRRLHDRVSDLILLQVATFLTLLAVVLVTLLS